MRRILPLALALSALALAGAAVGQFQPQPPRPPGGLPGAASPHSDVANAANQLFYQVERLRDYLAGLRAPQTEAVRRQVEAYYQDVLGFVRLLRRDPGQDRIVREYARLDPQGDAVVAGARALRDRQAGQLASRVEYADRLLQAAVYAGGGGGNQPPVGGRVARIARSLDTQAEDLLRLAQQVLGNDPFGQRLEREVRVFTRAADSFRQVAEGQVGIGLREAFDPVNRSWAVVVRSLAGHNPYWESQPLQQQAGQVNSLVTLVARMVEANPVPPLPPGPGPFPPGPGPGPGPGPFPPGPGPGRRAIYALGADAGGGPHVRVFHSPRREDFQDFLAYDPDFRGGVRVAAGDVDGDGVADVITAPGRGMRSLVRVFSGRDLQVIYEFFAFDGRYDDGVWVAAADFTGDGRADIVCGSDEGGLPVVRVFDIVGNRRVGEFAAYEARFRGGVRVAVGDVNGDGTPDLLTAPGPGRPVLVRVFDGRDQNRVLAQFDAYDPNFQGGGFLAAADIAGNRRAEVVVSAGVGGGPHVRIIDALRGQLVQEFFAYDEQFRGGARVACRDVDRDGTPDIITTPGPGMPAVVRVFSLRGGRVLNEFLGYHQYHTGGAFIAAR